MTDIELKVSPQNIKNKYSWKNVPLEMLVDEGQMIFEMHDLEMSGSAQIFDPSTKTSEKVEFKAPISTCQVLISLSEEYAPWGSLYPRINVD